MTPDRRQHRPCLAVSRHGERCLRTDAHGPEDIHRRGAISWGSRGDPGLTEWLRRTCDGILARDLTGAVLR